MTSLVKTAKGRAHALAKGSFELELQKVVPLVQKGKSFSALSASVMACGKSKKGGTTKYKLNVPVVAGTVGYYRLLTFKVTIDTATKKVTKVEKAFTKIE